MDCPWIQIIIYIYQRNAHANSCNRLASLAIRVQNRVLSRKNIWGGQLRLRAVLAVPGEGGGCGRGMCTLTCEARKLSPF